MPLARITRLGRAFLLLSLWGCGAALLRGADEPYVRGSDQIFWVPTLEQALGMSRDTGRSIMLMGYTLVDEKAATYSYKGGEQCSSVF